MLDKSVGSFSNAEVSILSINIAEAVYRELEIFVKFKSMQVDPGGIVVLGGVWFIKLFDHSPSA